MAEQFAPEQQGPGTPPVALDPVAKRTKFLAKFAELDPQADLNEEALGGILSDPSQRDEFTKYVNQLNPDFTMDGQELADALGYGADVKKKPGGNAGGLGSATGSGSDQLPPPNGSASVDDQEFVGQPQVLPMGYQLPGAPLPAAEQSLEPQLETVVPFAPGTAVNPLAANLPTIGTEAEPVVSRDPSQDENAFLQQLPAFTDGPAVEYGKERVAIPNDYTGAVPAGTYQLKLNGGNDSTQYFDRALSKSVNGKEQSYGEALAGKIKNAIYSMGQGLAEGAQSAANTVGMAGSAYVGLPLGDAPRTELGTEASEAIEKAKTPVAPYYQQSFSQHQNWETLGMAAADYAPMVIAQVAQTLAPELRAPAALQKAIGLVSATAFDADMYHAAREHAEQTFPDDPRKADLYTLFEGTLTVAGFKAGSKLMTELGDKLAYKASPFSLRRTVAADAANRVAAMEAQLGRQITDGEFKQALHESLRAALPKLAQIPKEAFQQAGTFAGVEAAKIVGNQAVAPALGGKADDLGPDQGFGFLKRVGEAALAGGTMGAITGGMAAALPGTRHATPLEAEARPELAPLEEAATVSTPLPETAPLEAVQTANNATDETPVVFNRPKPARKDFPADEAGDTAYTQANIKHWNALADYINNLKDGTVTDAKGEVYNVQTTAGGVWLTEPSTGNVFFKNGKFNAVGNPMVGDLTFQPAAEYSTTNAPAQAAPTPTSPVTTESSPTAAPEAAASAPDAASGELPATEPEPAPAAREPIAPAQPDPQQVKTLTAKQKATNNALDALDRYNGYNKTEQKSDAGKAARKELIAAASKAGLKVKDLPTGKSGFDGPRVTRSNEYTATTPAANHVPLDARDEEVHSFMEAVLFSGGEDNPRELLGLGIKMRGKELSPRELADAVKDIRAGRNTMRAQMVLDTLENSYHQGYVEKSTGTGLATQKFTVPIEDYLGSPDEAAAGEERELTDDELHDLAAQDPNFVDALASYTNPQTGEIDYARLADQGGRGALETFFDVTPEIATKAVALANERANQPATSSSQPASGAETITSPTEGSPQPDGVPTGSEGDAAAGQPAAEVAPLTDPNARQSAPAPTLAEQNVAAKQEFSDALAEFRAARKRGSSVAQSSILGVPAFSAEEAAALTKMAKAAVKLGAVKTKQVIARLRAQGLTDDDVTDDQLRPFIKQLLTDEGVRQPKASKAAPQNPTDPTNTKERQGAQSIAASGLSDELSKGMADRGTDRYTPKTLAETAAQVDRVIASEGIDKAYYTATHASTQHPKDVMEVLRIKVMAHYDAEVRRFTADPNADPAAIDQAVERAGQVADVYVAGGTEDGRALRARQTLQEYAPSVAVARLGKEVRETAAAERKKLEPAAKRRASTVRKEKQAALDAALASPGVQATLGQDFAPAPTRAAKTTAADPAGWGSKNKYFTKESAQKAREALRKLGLSTVVPPELIHFLGFHIEAGARSFADVSAKAVRDLGQKVRPLLPEAYEQAKQEFIRRGGDNKGFDGPDAVQGALRTELAENLAERIVTAAGPPQQAGFNPVRDMLDTLTKKVREKLPSSDKTPRAVRELLAMAMENRAEYGEVFEKSKALVESKINSLKISDAAKQKMRDELDNYHAEIVGQPYADQQLARAYRQAEDTVLPNYGSGNRGQQLDALATASDAAIARDRQAIIDHVTAGVSDPQAKQELADHVGQEFDERLAERQRALRVKKGVGHVQPTTAEDEQAAGPAAPSARVKQPMSQRVRDLLATRATDERVATRLAPDAVREGLAAEGQRLQQIARDHLTDPTDTGRSLADAFVRDAGLSGKQAQVFANAIEQEFNNQIAQARDKAVRDAYSRKVRTGEAKQAQDLSDRVRKLYTLSPTDEGRVLGLVADEAGLPELTAADNTRLYKLAQAISDAKGDNAKARAVQDFYIGVKSIRGLTGWEGVKSVMYANMLSGLGTQLKNINSTGLNTASDLFYATGWAGFLAAKQAVRSGDVKALGLALAPLKGILNRSGADRAYQMLTTGVRPPGYEGKFDEASDLEVMASMTPKNRKQAAFKAYASLAKYIPRLLSANDLMWSGGAEQMWAYNIALTDAVREGQTLPSDKIWESVNERLYGTSVRLADAQAQAAQELGVSGGGQYRMRVQELMEASRDQRIAAESKRAAAETTFNGPMEGFLGDVMSKLGRLTEAEAGRGTQPLKGIVPFTRIVANVTNAFLNYTPVGTIRAAKGGIGWEGNKPGKPNSFRREYSPMERSVVFAKSLTGAVVMAAAYKLLDDDNLTGNGPSDPAANRAWQQRGHKPYTIAGWNYKDSPWYYPLAAVAALKEAQAFDGADFENDVTFANRAARMIVATTQASFASLSLTNLQDFLNALSDPSKGKDPADRLGRYVQRTAGAVASSVLLPGSGLLRGVSRMGQQLAGATKREGSDVWGMMGQDVPGARDMLPRVYDQLGNEVPVGSNVPFMPMPEVQDATGASKRINEFLDKHHLFIPDVNRYQSDMHVLKARVGDLTPDEKRELRSMTDQQRKKFMLGKLGGEGLMPPEQWQQFYPKRGRLIKEKLLLHLPELEQLAKTNPREMQRRLKKYCRDATKAAKRGIDFTDLDVRQAPDEE